jgi:hypothetical protein
MMLKLWLLCGLVLGAVGLAESVAVASNLALYAVRLDVWSPRSPVEPKWGTAYTVAGLKIGPPPASAVGVTPAGECPPLLAQQECTASFGSGPPGPGPIRVGAPVISSATTSLPPVWVPAYSVLDQYFYYQLPSTYHLPGYPVATRHYSIHNRLGIFYASHPQAPTTTTTFYGASTTTRSGGQYSSSRSGTFVITPGVNRFGGTMRFFTGPQHYYEGWAERPSAGKYATYRWNAIRTQSNNGNAATRNTIGGHQSLGQSLTYGSTQLEHMTLQTASGSKVRYQYWGFSTIVPWTTGMATVRQPNGPYASSPTSLVATGSDTRTRTASGGLTGMISLVQPFLYHNYPAANGLTSATPVHLAFMRRVTLTFLPEPGAGVLLVAGFLGVVILYRLRRNSVCPSKISPHG